MASIKTSNAAYSRGQAARMRGQPFKSNPYKDPKCATTWSLGWIDWKEPAATAHPLPKLVGLVKRQVQRRRMVKYLRTVK